MPLSYTSNGFSVYDSAGNKIFWQDPSAPFNVNFVDDNVSGATDRGELNSFNINEGYFGSYNDGGVDYYALYEPGNDR